MSSNNEFKIKIAGVSHLVESASAQQPAKQQNVRLEARPGGWSIAHVLQNGKWQRIRFFIEKRKETPTVSTFWAKAGRQDVFGTLEKVLKAGSGAANDGNLVAQFPGKVRKVMVQEGQTVQAGEALLMVEAMKMEFTIKAPQNGVVKKLLVKEGDSITPNQTLVDVE